MCVQYACAIAHVCAIASCVCEICMHMCEQKVAIHMHKWVQYAYTMHCTLCVQYACPCVCNTHAHVRAICMHMCTPRVPLSTSSSLRVTFGTCMLWVEGQMSSYFLPVKMSRPTMWTCWIQISSQFYKYTHIRNNINLSTLLSNFYLLYHVWCKINIWF